MKRGGIFTFVLTATLLGVAAACVGDEAGSGGVRNEGDAGLDATPPVDSGGTDGQTSSDAASDADAGVPACNRSAPFGTPTLVPGDVNGKVNDDGFWLLPDQLTVFTSSARVVNGSVGGFDIFTGTRASLSSSFSPLVLAATASTDGDDRAPVVTSDGKTLYFTRNPLPSGGYHIYVATRANAAVAFEAPQLAAAPLNDTTNDFVAWVSPFEASGNYRIYFSSDRSGAAMFDLFVSVRSSGGFSTPVPVPSLNSPMQDTKLVMTPDELQAFIASTRSGSIGGQDLFYASRSDTNQGFSNPTPLAELNTAADDLPMWVTPDGCTLYFSSVRAGGAGAADVFMATRGK